MKANYVFNTIRCFYNFHNQNKKCGNYPLIQDIEVTNACNLNCEFCQRQRIIKRGIGFMTKETFGRIFNEQNKPMLRHTRLFMHGEPLLHPEIIEFVKTAKQYSKTVGFTTNGTLMNQETAIKLLDAGLDTICFSFEGINKQTYESLRKGADYEKTKANILEFIKQNKLRNNPCKVNLAIIDHPSTSFGLAKFLSEWQPKADVTILKLHDWGLTGKRLNYCLWPWWGLTVYWNGDVAPCCLSEVSDVLGNVNEKSIKEIWNNQKYRNLRSGFKNGYSCQTCSLSERTFVDSYLKVKSPGFFGFCKNLYSLGKASTVKLNQIKLLCAHRWSYSGKAKTFAESVWRIYNETPIRQNRAYPHYGISLETLVPQFKMIDGDKVSSYPESRRCDFCRKIEFYNGKGNYGGK